MLRFVLCVCSEEKCPICQKKLHTTWEEHVQGQEHMVGGGRGYGLWVIILFTSCDLNGDFLLVDIVCPGTGTHGKCKAIQYTCLNIQQNQANFLPLLSYDPQGHMILQA